MGEIAKMMLDGILCERCGEFIGDSVGYPRTCHYCAASLRKQYPMFSGNKPPSKRAQKRAAQAAKREAKP